MSENLDLVRSIVAAWERGDFGQADWADADIEYAVIGGGEAFGSSKGSSAMARAWGWWLRAWDDVHVVADSYREVDAERVLVLLTTIGHGKASRAEPGQTHVEGAVVFHIRTGRVTRLDQYMDRARALTDVGLAD